MFLMMPMLAGIAAAAEVPPVRILDAGEPREASEGHVLIDWASTEALPEGLEYELQQALEESFATVTVRYRGRDTATFVSGLPEGEYWFRLRARERARTGPWSEPLLVRVEYVSRGLVWSLLGAGAAAFLATAATLIVSHRRLGGEAVAR